MKKRMLFIAGNWKMNKTPAETEKMLNEMKPKLAPFAGRLEIAVCPAFTSLDRANKVIGGSNIKLGAQDLSDKANGAYTGDIAADMLLDVGVKYVIIGHSERRQYHDESDEIVNKKTKFALGKGLLPIVCIGETLQEREGNKTAEVITSQVKGSLAGLSENDILRTTIAYEPVWAIGTGKTATPEQAQEVHALIRKLLAEAYGRETAEKVIIQYGGSVKADNSAALMGQQDIDGALVGGASLDIDSFVKLITNAL